MSELGYYDLGPTAQVACELDQRFSYCLYVPRGYSAEQTNTRLAVIVHGTLRTCQRYRDEFADFAEQHDCIVLAPLFPAGLIEPGELDSYKYIEFHGLRFDRILLAMVDEVTRKYQVDTRRFLVHGFSGGGHFAHRFYYLHADRLLGVSIGAPGMITLIDPTRRWWIGTQDLVERFGIASTAQQLRDVPVQLVVGVEDLETWEINDASGERWMDGADAAGKTRVERLAALRRNYGSFGISVRHDLVPGVGHEGYKLLEPVLEFFADVLTSTRNASAG